MSSHGSGRIGLESAPLNTMVPSSAGVKGVAFPVWLWPSVLSLDAPAVAICWQLSLARSVRLWVSAPVTAALAVAVWSIYVLDRILDGSGQQSPPHMFAQLYRKPLLWSLAVANGMVAFLVIPALPLHVFAGGLWIAAACAWYLIAAQGILRGSASKKIAMSFLFSAGVVLPLPISSLTYNFLATAFVVWANTQLIERWERDQSQSLVFRYLLLAGGIAMLGFGGRYFEALALGCWFMLIVDAGAKRMNADVRRSLADAVLVAAVWIVS